jgi:hypothetical protein
MQHEIDVALLDLQGPIFVHEPPYKIEFSNNTGGHIHCSGHANPYPEVIFLILTNSLMHIDICTNIYIYVHLHIRMHTMQHIAV